MVSDTYTKMFKALSPKNITEYAKAGEGTVKDGIKIYVLAWFVTLILGIIGFFLAVGTAGAEMQALSGMIGLDLVGFLGVVVLIFASILGLIWGVVINYITQYAGAFTATSVFKGKGKFEQQFYIAMLFTGAIMIIGSVLGIISAIIPAFGIISGAIMLILGLWTIYLLYHTIKEVHKIELVGALVSMIVVFIVGLAFVVIVGLVLAMLGIAALGAGALGGAAATGGLENLGM